MEESENKYADQNAAPYSSFKIQLMMNGTSLYRLQLAPNQLQFKILQLANE
jgi:hypothetical protein